MTTEPVYAGVWLDPELAAALDLSARDARDSRAGHLRKLIAEAMKASGHLDATPRRVRRRRGATA